MKAYDTMKYGDKQILQQDKVQVKKNEKRFVILGVIIGILLLVTLEGPSVILKMDRQEKKADSYTYSDMFFDEYDEVRAHLMDTVDELKKQGVETQLHSYPIAKDEESTNFVKGVFEKTLQSGEKKQLLTLQLYAKVC